MNWTFMGDYGDESINAKLCPGHSIEDVQSGEL